MSWNEYSNPDYLEDLEYEGEYEPKYPHSDYKKPVEFEAKIIAESYKAFLIEVKRVRFWVPKSVIMSHKILVPGTSDRIKTPKWLLLNQGIIL